VQNHDEEVTDMIRSVLPSTARQGVRATRRLVHPAERRTVKNRLRAGDGVVVVRGAISDMIWDRRAADKAAQLVRWAPHQVCAHPVLRDASTAERLEQFRRLLPDTTIGRHALSHIAWPLERLEHQHRLQPHRWRAPSIAPTVRALYEAGYHGELNKRLKSRLLPTLAGIHDIDRFAEAAGQSTRAVVAAFATETGLVRATASKPHGVGVRRWLPPAPPSGAGAFRAVVSSPWGTAEALLERCRTQWVLSVAAQRSRAYRSSGSRRSGVGRPGTHRGSSRTSAQPLM
jgi:hypothetical protein